MAPGPPRETRMDRGVGILLPAAPPLAARQARDSDGDSDGDSDSDSADSAPPSQAQTAVQRQDGRLARPGPHDSEARTRPPETR